MIGNEGSVVVDTSIIIDFLRSQEKNNTFFMKLLQRRNCKIPIECVAELYTGKTSSQKHEQLLIETIINRIEIYIPDTDFMKRTGFLIRAYQLSFVDACVAQLALDDNCPLASLDNKAFKPINNLKLLSI